MAIPKISLKPNRVALGFELLFLFYGIPLLLACFPFPLVQRFGLMAVFFYVILIIMQDQQFDIKIEWKGCVTRPVVKKLILLYLINIQLIIGCTYLLKPERLFLFPLERPYFWLAVMILYPVLSVLPQEIIYRTFFFRRYQDLFPTPLTLIAINALSFSFMHIIFHNYIAPSFCLLGGLIFASTYYRSRSLYLVSIEHALYGCLIFTAGIGPYFLLSSHLTK